MGYQLHDGNRVCISTSTMLTMQARADVLTRAVTPDHSCRWRMARRAVEGVTATAATTMDARLSYFDNDIAMKFARHMNSAGVVLTGSSLPAATQELVKLRASQINSCGMCTDMHTKDALHAGESQVRLDLGRGLAGGHRIHRGRAGRPGTRRAGHPHRRRRRRRDRPRLGECGQAL